MKTIFAAMASVLIGGFLGAPAVAHADPCINGTVHGFGAGGDYFVCQNQGWLHVLPTRNGLPAQPLPATCVRFPDKFMCPVDGTPPGIEWTTSGRWYPGT